MRGFRLGLVVAAVVIGVLAAVGRNWWTVTGMACLILAQLLGERDARRRAARGEVAPRE